MEDNDIGISYVARYAVKFEGLLMHFREEDEEEKKGLRGLFKRNKGADTVWVPNDMAMKSLLHLANHLHINVEVVTYMPDDVVSTIEEWLARKGAYVQVYAYADPFEWAEDMRRNTEIQRYYTDSPHERDIIGFQHVTVVRPSEQWGF